jgi:hypothetical protein
VRPPTGHYKRLLEEAYLNHAYPVRHKLKDYGMMRSFMTSRSLTWGAELDKGLDGSNTMLFPKENDVMIVYGGCPLLGRHRVASLSPRMPTRCGWGHGLRGVMLHVFLFPNKYLYKYMYIHIKTYFRAVLRGKIKERRAVERRGGRHEVMCATALLKLVPRTGTRGQCFLQMLQDEANRHQDLTS